MHAHTPDDDGYIRPVCDPCGRELRHDELGRRACRLCQERVDLALRQLPGPDGLYARLATVLTPGSRSGGPAVSGSRTAPLPLRLEVLNLATERGPIVSTLEGWVRDWETYGRADMNEAGTLQQRVDHAVQTLRFNLGWAATSHPAFADFADEIYHMRWKCEAHVLGEKPPIRVPVRCGCGSTTKVTLNTSGFTCQGCGTDYGHSEALRLPFATQAAA